MLFNNSILFQKEQQSPITELLVSRATEGKGSQLGDKPLYKTLYIKMATLANL